MRLAASPCLLALVVSAATPLAAQDEGFGGAPATSEPAPADTAYDDVPVGADDDAAVEDEAAFRARALQEAAIVSPPREDEGPKLREISETRPARGAYGRLVADMQSEVKETFPLLSLRERVAALAVEAEALLDDDLRYREAPAKRAEHEWWSKVLARVEGVAFHKMRSCIASTIPAWSETYTAPSLYRMTPGGPVLASEEEKRALPKFDPPGCERIRLVDDALIEKVRRLVEVEDTLRNGRLGYYERDQRDALEEEAEAIQRDIGEGGPAPLPKAFERRSRDDDDDDDKDDDRKNTIPRFGDR